MNLMRYKDHIASIEYDDSADSFHGLVLGMRDVIDFYGSNPAELREEFKNSVEEYLAWCAEEGKPPEKTFQGKLTVRPPAGSHRRWTIAAAAGGMSLNNWLVSVADREAQKIVGPLTDCPLTD
jgi:predicted HicB family RNase H-like nuclease